MVYVVIVSIYLCTLLIRLLFICHICLNNFFEIVCVSVLCKDSFNTISCIHLVNIFKI